MGPGRRHPTGTGDGERDLLQLLGGASLGGLWSTSHRARQRRGEPCRSGAGRGFRRARGGFAGGVRRSAGDVALRCRGLSARSGGACSRDRQPRFDRQTRGGDRSPPREPLPRRPRRSRIGARPRCDARRTTRGASCSAAGCCVEVWSISCSAMERRREGRMRWLPERADEAIDTSRPYPVRPTWNCYRGPLETAIFWPTPTAACECPGRSPAASIREPASSC